MTTETFIPTKSLSGMTKPHVLEPATPKKERKRLPFYQLPNPSPNGQYRQDVDLTALYGPNDRWPRTIAEANKRWPGIYTAKNAATLLAHEPIELHNGWPVWQVNKIKSNRWPKNIVEAYERPHGPYTIENIETIIEDESIELFHGWLVWQKMTNAKERGAVVNIHDFIRPFARKIGFGKVFNDQTECIMADGATLIPDASLISWQRWREIMRPHGPNDRPVFMGAPELVIEARSPSNTRKEERTKRTQYFANGTQIVWDVDDAQQKIWVYHASAPNNPVEYGIGDEIKCELLPGWKRSVAHIFAEEEVPMEAIAGEIIEDSREEGIAIGARNAIIGVLPMLAQLRFGEELPDDVSQQLQALDLATLQSLQASVQTSPDMETWLAQIS